MKILTLLLLLFVVSFIQNMAFTFSSRSRNSGDANYHRWAAIGSNGIWFITQVLIFQSIWKEMMAGNYVIMILGGIVYTIATSEGSVFMMKGMLGESKVKFLNKIFVEKDKRKVGSNDKNEG